MNTPAVFSNVHKYRVHKIEDISK